MTIKVIILDFDGIIVESVGVKDGAFRSLFAVFPEKLDEIIDYHLAHNATVRFEKFEYIYKSILELPYNDEVREELSSEFSRLVFDKIVGCPFVPGALSFLEHFKEILPIYLVSMSPKQELNNIIRARNLKTYFRRVYDSSWRKVDAIDDILKAEGVSRDEAVFIGDAYEDYLSARGAGVPFIGRDSGKSFHGADVRVFEDMVGIKELLNDVIDNRESLYDSNEGD